MKIESFYEGRLVDRWIDRGEACDGSGRIFRHQQFRTAFDGSQIIHSTQVVCMTDKDIKHLKALPDVKVMT